MKCPICLQGDTHVLDSRDVDEGLAIRRRRECEQCSFRFSTIESVEILNLRVVKNDGSEEAYDREKIEKGLHKALEKRSVSKERFRAVITGIERDIQMKAKQDKISSGDIGAIVVKHLRKIDKVAYLRFASVYYDFQDLNAFQEAVVKLQVKNRLKKDK